jgi:hypothetical protein
VYAQGAEKKGLFGRGPIASWWVERRSVGWFWMVGCTGEMVARGGDVVGEVLSQIDVVSDVYEGRGIGWFIDCICYHQSRQLRHEKNQNQNESFGFPAAASFVMQRTTSMETSNTSRDKAQETSRGSDQHHGSQQGSQQSGGAPKASYEEVWYLKSIEFTSPSGETRTYNVITQNYNGCVLLLHFPGS